MKKAEERTEERKEREIRKEQQKRLRQAGTTFWSLLHFL
jgi:hypothetical protein